MTYSYLQTVFPNFKSTHTFDQKIFNSLLNSPLADPLNKVAAAAPSTPQTPLPTPAIEDGNETLAPVANVNSLPLVSDNKEEFKSSTTKDNLRFFQPQLPSVFLEKMGTDKMDCGDCKTLIKHINSCESCKATLLKEYNLGKPSMVSEYVEVLMYIIFGILVLLLLDRMD